MDNINIGLTREELQDLLAVLGTCEDIQLTDAYLVALYKLRSALMLNDTKKE